jgi:hypothetical protein
MLIERKKLYSHAAHLILIVLAITVILTFRQFGITWDEELQSQYGQAVVDYYFSGFKDQRYAEIFNLYLYGGMFDGLASLIDRFTPFSVYETRHLVNAFFGLLGLWGTWRLGRLLGGRAVGLLALVLLTLTPMYYGHMYNNPKDIPFAAGIVWSIYFMTRCYAAMPKPNAVLLFKLGIIVGLTLGVRVGGIMLLLFWGVPMAATSLIPLKKGLNRIALRESLTTAWQYFIRLVLPVFILTYIVMLICWPWAQQSPIMNPLRAIGEFSNFPQDVEILLDGTTYRSTELPWYYVPLYFGVQLPELILILLAANILLLPRLWRRINPNKRSGFALVYLMAFLPIVYAMLRHPALYDAVRHFLFAVPLFCILAAFSGHELSAWAMSHFRKPAARFTIASGICIIIGLFIATQLDIMERLHPYEYIYANRFAGGVAGAYGKYELDYWGSSFKEAAEQIQKMVTKEGGVPPGKIYRIAICGPWAAAMIYLPPDYEPVVANEPAEFFLSTTRWMCQNMRSGKEVIRIKRLGAPLAIVKDLR